MHVNLQICPAPPTLHPTHSGCRDFPVAATAVLQQIHVNMNMHCTLHEFQQRLQHIQQAQASSKTSPSLQPLSCSAATIQHKAASTAGHTRAPTYTHPVSSESYCKRQHLTTVFTLHAKAFAFAWRCQAFGASQAAAHCSCSPCSCSPAAPSRSAPAPPS